MVKAIKNTQRKHYLNSVKCPKTAILDGGGWFWKIITCKVTIGHVILLIRIWTNNVQDEHYQ